MKRLIYILPIFCLLLVSKLSNAQTIIDDRTGSWNGFPWIIVPDGQERAFNVDGRNGKTGRLKFLYNNGPGVLQGMQYNSQGWFIFGGGDPGAPFHVNSDALFSRKVDMNSRVNFNGDMYWKNKVNWVMDHGDAEGDFSFDFKNDNGKGVWGVYAPNHGFMLSVRNNGRVGINNTDPTEALDVKGNGKFSGTLYADRVSLNVGSFPDYVFEENYSLRSLNDLDNYIVKNKHLPGIPKASSVEKNGMDVGEMNRILVEKVEELTLYTVNQQKMIDQLQKEVTLIKETSGNVK